MARRPSKHLRPARPLSSGHATSATKRDGRWIVRSVSGSAATKPYRCPGCNVEIAPGTPHVVAWPDDSWTALGIRTRRAPALAHQLLAATSVTATAPAEGLFSTQLGSTGPRVAFLHGLFGQGKNWTTIAKGLSESARVMLVDLPNHGRSPGQITSPIPTWPTRSQSCCRPKAVMISGPWSGTRWGKVAMTLALLRPQLVERLSVVDVSPVPTGEVSEFDTFIRGMRSIDLEHLTGRKEADSQLAAYVSDPVIRSFLLQNLRRDHSLLQRSAGGGR